MSTVDIQARQGDTLHVALSIDGGGSPETPYPADDYDIALGAAWYHHGELVLDGDLGGIALVAEGGGKVTVDLTPAQTLTLPPGRIARYQITATKKSDDAVTTLFDGYFDVAEKVVPR